MTLRPRFPAGVRLALLCVSIALANAACRTPDVATIRVATLNIAHGVGLSATRLGLSRNMIESNLTAIADVLRRVGPDVVALQEADLHTPWAGDFDQVGFLAQAAGYPSRFRGLHVDRVVFGAPVRYGTALLSHRPLANAASTAFDAGPLDTKGFVAAEVEFDGHPVTVVSVHLDFASAARRRQQVRLMVASLKPRDSPLIVMGDLNSGWDIDDDAVQQLARALNLQAFQPLADALRTYPSASQRRRLDWILISDELEFVDYHNWLERLSDHLGVSAELRWRDDERPD
jgi:endonuclease/exonuclease/phosphatase family metal-dependent hydrolase